jgi:hypothetical protein
MIEFELWPHRIAIHIGDFGPSMFVPGMGYEYSTHISGLLTESEPGTFGFVLMIHNWGFGVSMRFRPGPWTPDEE